MLSSRVSFFYVISMAMLLFSVEINAATPESISINGKVVAAPCTLDTVNSDLSINGGDVPRNAFYKDNVTSVKGNRIFRISLKDCPASTKEVTATFSGTNVRNTGFYTVNVINGGTAKGVSLMLSFRDIPVDSPFIDGTAKLPVIPDGTGTGTVKFRFIVFLYSEKMLINSPEAVKPGTINAAVTFTFSYQ